jgi:D-psicose/D-tagatose/L-ribulose 3-epimerase
MLPVGLHLSFWQTKWSDELSPLIKRTKDAGFDVCEFPLLQLEMLPLKDLRKTLADNAMQASCSVGLDQSQDITSPDPALRKQGIQFLRKCLEAAKTLGSPVLVGVTYAPWGYFPADDLAERRKQSILSIKEVSHIAQDNGVTLCLEIVNRFEGYLLNSAKQGLDFLQEVDSPNVKLHLDTFHMNIEEDNIAKAIRSAGSNLGHIHCVDNNRKAPGKGHIQWEAIFLALKQIQYPGYVVAEVFVNPAGEVGRGLSIWRPLASDLMETARETAAFLKKGLAYADI